MMYCSLGYEIFTIPAPLAYTRLSPNMLTTFAKTVNVSDGLPVVSFWTTAMVGRCVARRRVASRTPGRTR